VIKIYCRTPVIFRKKIRDPYGTIIAGTIDLLVKVKLVNKERRIENEQGESFVSEFSMIVPTLTIADSVGVVHLIDHSWFVVFNGVDRPIRKIANKADWRDRGWEIFL
jgi:hypothetical protein